jgi:hypothetical protein
MLACPPDRGLVSGVVNSGRLAAAHHSLFTCRSGLISVYCYVCSVRLPSSWLQEGVPGNKDRISRFIQNKSSCARNRALIPLPLGTGRRTARTLNHYYFFWFLFAKILRGVQS